MFTLCHRLITKGGKGYQLRHSGVAALRHTRQSVSAQNAFMKLINLWAQIQENCLTTNGREKRENDGSGRSKKPNLKRVSKDTTQKWVTKGIACITRVVPSSRAIGACPETSSMKKMSTADGVWKRGTKLTERGASCFLRGHN